MNYGYFLKKKNKKRIHVYVYIHNDWTMDWIVKF